MDKLDYRARAKINLGLDVCRRLENGYHEVKMILQSVNIYDELTFQKRTTPDVVLSVQSKDYLGDLNSNLIVRAAKLMKQQYNISDGIEIKLKKNIPVAAGMAGGSTDAASTLFGINKIYELGLSQNKLMELGVQIGADVPYCIMRGTALAEGIGEQLSRLKPVPHMWIVVAKPPINISTKLVYEQLDMNDILYHPNVDKMIQAINKESIEEIAANMGNVLERVTIPLYPIIDSIKNDMLSHGAINAMMSGSGPTVFGIFPNERTALNCQAYLKLKKEAKQVYITETFN